MSDEIEKEVKYNEYLTKNYHIRGYRPTELPLSKK